jgi:hypothetical protein
VHAPSPPDARPTVEEREAALDDHLGLGSRHERSAVGLQRQPPEAPLAEDIRERLSLPAPADELAVGVALGI